MTADSDYSVHRTTSSPEVHAPRRVSQHEQGPTDRKSAEPHRRERKGREGDREQEPETPEETDRTPPPVDTEDEHSVDYLA